MRMAGVCDGRKLSLSLVVSLTLTILLLLSQPAAKFDRVWSDVILKSEKTQITKGYLIIDITPRDATRLGGLPIARETMAEALVKLHQSGAKRILLDMAFTEGFASSDDGALHDAMANLGPAKLAISHVSDEKFSSSSTFTDMRLLTDPDRWTRRVRTPTLGTGPNPALWLATGERANVDIPIDLRLDPSTVERVSLSHVLDHDRLDYADRIVIVSPTSEVAKSQIQLPLTDNPDRALAVVLAGESVSAGYPRFVRIAEYANIMIAFGLMLLGVILGLYSNSKRLLVIGGLALSVGIVIANMGVMKWFGGPGTPILHFSCFLVGVFVSICNRLKLFSMIAGFLKGDLSPEEAWAWRAHEASKFPVYLFNAMGDVRRMNSVALEIKPCISDDFGKRCLANLRQNDCEISIKDENGEIRIFSIEQPSSGVPIVVLKDVTQRYREFNAVKANTHHLRQTIDYLRVSQFQAVERAQSLEKMKDSAEKSSQFKSDFIANMSHELRTPLNAINGFSDILHRELFGPLGDPRYKEFAGDILLSGQHLLSLINDILDMSKIEAGKMKLNLELTEVDALLAQAVRIVRERASKANVHLYYDAKPCTPFIADKRALKQVVLNLLSNAIKFTPEGGSVTLRMDYSPAELAIRVSDTGVGISAENIKRLATPFQQVNDDYSKNKEGTGLGLSLSKSLVELHGGKFHMSSVVGQGTTVLFTIPSGVDRHYVSAA